MIPSSSCRGPSRTWNVIVPRGRTRSKLTKSERMEIAFEGFAKGEGDSSIARKLHVTRQTVASYRAKYEERIHARAAANPNFLRDVVSNTMRALEELDKIRADAWAHMEPRRTITEHTCPECQAEFIVKERIEVSDDTRSKYMGHLLKAQDMRAKLLGVLGIKTDIFVAVMQVKVVADSLMRFMGEELCEEDRQKLERFLMSPELRDYMGGGNLLEAVDAEVIEEHTLETANA